MKTLTITAPAKVNLFLGITGIRADGYHELITLMQPLDLADRLTVDLKEPGLSLTCDDPALETPGNLVLKAARAWYRKAGLEPAAKFHLEKQIPVAAGLGGGSSDAAACLSALNALHGGKLPPQSLAELAGGLGADVPFFLAGCTALCTGIGEKVHPKPDFPRLNYVLVNPGIPISTPKVYKDFDLTWTNQAKHTRIKRLLDNSRLLESILANDLEAVTFRAHPVLAGIRDSIESLGATKAMMSGSGATIFGIFPDPESARRAAQALTGQNLGWVRACRGH